MTALKINLLCWHFNSSCLYIWYVCNEVKSCDGMLRARRRAQPQLAITRFYFVDAFRGQVFRRCQCEASSLAYTRRICRDGSCRQMPNFASGACPRMTCATGTSWPPLRLRQPCAPARLSSLQYSALAGMKYEMLKKFLLSAFLPSKWQRAQRIPAVQDLGDSHLSQLGCGLPVLHTW